MIADGSDTRTESQARPGHGPAAGRGPRLIAAASMLLAMVVMCGIVWAGAVSALYQAALVLAGLFFGAAAVRLVARRRAALSAAKGVGFVVTTLLIAELCALTVHVTGLTAMIRPPLVRYGDGARTMTRDSMRLGYEPAVADGAVRAVKRRADGSVIYDVTYTLRDGLRVTRGDPDGPCTVVFLIDSIAFGEGINDADTLPQRFSEATGFRLNVVNLSFSGYGPQQMLARLEESRLDRIIHSPLAAAYYISADDHVLRIAGLTVWGRFDPRYALIDGAVTRTGRFHSLPSLSSLEQFRRDLPGFLSASGFYHYIIRGQLPDLAGRIPAARALYIEALSRADALLRSRDGVPLTILVWHAEDLTRPALAELGRRGMEVVRFETLIGSPTHENTIPGDGHPTPLANRRAGEALARRFPGCPRR